MEYILQMEKLFKYFELALELEQMQKLLVIKRNFNNDYNLLGCFIKDFLSIENNGKISDDENLYNDFVVYLNKKINENKLKDSIIKLYNYSSYYLLIAFEDTDDLSLLNYISTINACFALDCYPYLMKLLDKYSNKKINSNSFFMMLKSLVEIVLKRFENPKQYNSNFATLGNSIEDYILEKTSERLVG